MKELQYNREDLICALATGWNTSALGVIRCSGEGCIPAAARVFSRPEALESAGGHTLVYGRILEPGTGRPVDEAVLGVYRAPRSYTGEESLEITCHGGIPAVEGVLRCLHAAGFRDAGPGEFTMRAFLNGKLDLTRAEAVNEIVSARTAAAHDLALRRLSGAVEGEINRIKAGVLDLLSRTELQLDYPEDEVGEEELPDFREVRRLREELERLAGSFREGRLFQEGVRAAFTGATNAGKSSLFNRFLKEERAIVSEFHGTTRDYLEACISLSGIPVSLYDTAGLRDAENPVEQEGIRRSGQVAAAADLVIHVIDGTAGATPAEAEALAEGDRAGDRRTVFVWNKIDAGGKAPPAGAVPVSALTGEGLSILEKELLERIRQLAGVTSGESGRPVIDSLRQKELLDRAAAALAHVQAGLEGGPGGAGPEEAGGFCLDGLAVDLREALDALGEITGEVTTAEILEHMFSSFCVGK